MKKLVFTIVVLALSFVSCEKSELNDEIDSFETQSTEQEDSNNSGGSPLDPTNDD